MKPKPAARSAPEPFEDIDPLMDRRTQTWRRQANEAFLDEHGKLSLIKTIAIFGQIVLLYHLGRDFDDLVGKVDSLIVVTTAVLMPDMLRKWLNLKYGTGNGEAK
jgi:hypothetical protein